LLKIRSSIVLSLAVGTLPAPFLIFVSLSTWQHYHLLQLKPVPYIEAQTSIAAVPDSNYICCNGIGLGSRYCFIMRVNNSLIH
jgi:hypothetical protein